MSGDVTGRSVAQRLVWGSLWGVGLGGFFYVLSLLKPSEDPSSVVLVSLTVGGATGGAVYGLMLPTVLNRVRAGLAMGIACSFGLTVMWGLYGSAASEAVFYGAFLGLSSGLAFGVGWRPGRDASE